MKDNCSVLVHTFNRYQKYWDGFIHGYNKHVKFDIPKYFGTDTTFHGEHNFTGWNVIYSGDMEWSNRLVKLLQQIPTEYVWYQQEDMHPCAAPPDMAELMKIVIEKDIYRLQISPVIQFYSLTGSKIPLYFHWKSKYLVSHQPSIWKKSFLLECLQPNEDPWKNEYEGTKRLNREEFAGKIAIYPYDWFTHESPKVANN